ASGFEGLWLPSFEHQEALELDCGVDRVIGGGNMGGESRLADAYLGDLFFNKKGKGNLSLTSCPASAPTRGARRGDTHFPLISAQVVLNCRHQSSATLSFEERRSVSMYFWQHRSIGDLVAHSPFPVSREDERRTTRRAPAPPRKGASLRKCLRSWVER